ncbi:MAG: hypothetical protein LBQ80_03505, partial [Clostridium sp.]|nr:hypothetical protein [Clostridium sp.]
IDNISTAVPTIILCGSADQLVPPSQFGERLHTELDALGVYNSYFLFDGAGHWIFGGTEVADEVADYCELYF